jgi:diacylglycerol O-acyltransferase
MAVPIQLDDPLERLQATHDSGQAMKSFLAATRDVNLARLLQILPPLYARAMEWIVERTRGEVNTAGNMILSNVVGPREPLRIGNATVENWLSIGQVSGGAGLNITVWSYAQHFNVCIMADAEVIPDGWKLMDCISDALNEYVQIVDSRT